MRPTNRTSCVPLADPVVSGSMLALRVVPSGVSATRSLSRMRSFEAYVLSVRPFGGAPTTFSVTWTLPESGWRRSMVYRNSGPRPQPAHIVAAHATSIAALNHGLGHGISGSSLNLECFRCVPLGSQTSEGR